MTDYCGLQVELRYGKEVTLKKNERQSLCAYKLDESAKMALVEKTKEDNLAKFEHALGFRRVFNAIVDLKKPIVGHNLLYDLMFVHRWLDIELPSDFTEFRNILNSNFPYVFDTKYIDSCGVLGVKYEETTLAQCMQRYKVENACTDVETVEGTATEKNVTTRSLTPIEISSDCSFDPCAEAYHNAGYDAYCTGYIFAKQLEQFTSAYIKKNGIDESGMDTSNWNQPVGDSAFQAFSKACVNWTFMMQSIFHMNLSSTAEGGQLKYEGSIFRVTGFPRSLTTEMLLQFFIESMQSESIDAAATDVTVIWVDDYSLFLAVNLPHVESNILTTSVVRSLGSRWTVQSYEDYQLGLTTSEDETITEQSPLPVLPTLRKRLSSMSTWMTDIFSSSCASDANEDSFHLNGGATKRSRL